MHFAVLPGDPNYLLRFPDLRRIPFTQVLSSYNDFEPGRPWIDLEPLMELRIENAYYEPGAPRTGLTGFLGTEVARYLVGAKGMELLSVQPMEDRPADQAPVQDLILDRGQSFSHYRLYYEIVFARDHGSNGSVLLGAKITWEGKRFEGSGLKPDISDDSGSSNADRDTALERALAALD